MNGSVPFITRDHELASTMITLGYDIQRLDWEKQDDGTPFGVFVFNGVRSEFERISRDFFMGKELAISPKELFSNHKKLRSWLIEEKGRMRNGNIHA